MNVTVMRFTPELAVQAQSGDGVVVIDVLRATTTIASALANGAREVIPVSTIEDALRSRTGAAGPVLLGGEYQNNEIPGFDLGNSPLQYTASRVTGCSIVLRTTNGTQALAGIDAGWICCAAFVNLSAVIRALAAEHLHRIYLICAGQDGTFSLEDFLCAGAIAGALETGAGANLDDAAQAARLAYRACDNGLSQALRSGTHAQALIALGRGDDVAFAAQVDRYDVVPRLIDGKLVAALLS